MTISINLDRVEKITMLLQRISNTASSRCEISSSDQLFVAYFIRSIKTVVSRRRYANNDTELGSYLSFTEAITALEGISIEQKEVSHPKSLDADVHTSALLAHTTLARKF